MTAHEKLERGFQERDSFIQAIINSLTANIAVLDRAGNIVYVNESWEMFARRNGDTELKGTSIGVNYLAVCKKAAAEDEHAAEALEGIESVMNGSLRNFSLEYPCHSPTVKRWFMMFVTPLGTEGEGAVVSHNNITERRLAEETLRKAHDELEIRVGERTKELGKANLELRKEIEDRKRAEKGLQRALAEIEQLRDRLQRENIYLRDEIKLEHNFEEIIGQSDALKYVLFKVEQVAPTDATALILGETGTGKELIARAIHNASSRRDRPLVKVNCATLPSNLIESELFGHEKGAFTGAQAKQIGRFELADGGTLFLDEIGDLPLDLQVKLLRVLQDGEFERLGSSRTIKSDVRVIAATNRNLREEVRKGRFREDLWYRLNVFPITVPPLRQRKEDIPLLVKSFVNKFSMKMGKKITTIEQKEAQALQDYSWPGNVRELENVIERAVIVSQGPTLSVEVPKTSESTTYGKQTLEEIEREHIIRILDAHGWRIEGKDGAAQILGLNPGTLRSRMKKLGIKRPVER
ncbi:MAG: sigma 54-interacting transcriptional regulator [Desulfobacteraceae bacterium]|jgi:transcriptional regulator with GAF, ATPase, and Fis domain